MNYEKNSIYMSIRNIIQLRSFLFYPGGWGRKKPQLPLKQNMSLNWHEEAPEHSNADNNNNNNDDDDGCCCCCFQHLDVLAPLHAAICHCCCCCCLTTVYFIFFKVRVHVINNDDDNNNDDDEWFVIVVVWKKFSLFSSKCQVHVFSLEWTLF